MSYLCITNSKFFKCLLCSSDIVCTAGKAVIRAGENGAPFPLKRRDQLLDYILTLMGHDNDDEFIDTSVEILRTQVKASTWDIHI